MALQAKRIRLNWDEFHSTVSKSFCSIRDEEFLADVTLIAEDNSQVAAHRLVLSACSEYFKTIFKNNPALPRLVLCLEMVDGEALTQLLDFMYNGEVMMEEDKLETFLKLAKRFKMKGLCEESTCKTTRENVGDLCDVSIGIEDSLATPKFEPVDIKIEEEEEESQECTDISVSQESRLVDLSRQVRNMKGKDEKELDEMISQFMERRLEDKRYVCKLCGKTSPLSRNLKNHIETHLEGLEFQCKFCEKKCKTRAMLAMHVSKYHRNPKTREEETALPLGLPLPTVPIEITKLTEMMKTDGRTQEENVLLNPDITMS